MKAEVVNLNVETIKKIADFLNVSADRLIGIEDEPTTIAAHFDGTEYTEEQLNRIKAFAAFIKTEEKK